MKVKKKLVNERRENILKLLNEGKSIYINDLTKIFNVSSLTIRRDLDELKDMGLLIRFHGGAKLIDKGLKVENYRKKSIKERIAKKAAEYIEEGDIIFINSSSTALMVLECIKDKHVTIITNNANALNLELDPKINLMLTGGTISFPKHTLTGTFTMNNIKTIKADKVIMGVSGVDFEEGITTSVIEEVEVNRYMLHNSSKERIIVAESDKFNHIDNFRSSSINSVTKIVTDHCLELKTINRLERMGIQVVIT